MKKNRGMRLKLSSAPLTKIYPPWNWADFYSSHLISFFKKLCWDHNFQIVLVLFCFLWHHFSSSPGICTVANDALIAAWVYQGLRPSLDAIPKDAPEELIEIIKICWVGEPTERPIFKGKMHQKNWLRSSRYAGFGKENLVINSVYAAERSNNTTNTAFRLSLSGMISVFAHSKAVSVLCCAVPYMPTRTPHEGHGCTDDLPTEQQQFYPWFWSSTCRY